MKKILFVLSSLLIVTSCFKDGVSTSQSYTLVADFQYKGVEFLPDSTLFNTTNPSGFGYDLLNFYHQLDPGKLRVDGGFIISSQQMPVSGKTEDLDNTYRCYLKGLKAPFSNSYTVYYQNPDDALMPEHDMGFPFTENGSCTMQRCYVTNTVEVADYIKENFVLGDRMTLKATGYLDGVMTGEAEINLADFSAQKDSIVSTWTAFDLSKLGNVEYVDFKITSSKEGTPAYFCMDEMVAKVEISY